MVHKRSVAIVVGADCRSRARTPERGQEHLTWPTRKWWPNEKPIAEGVGGGTRPQPARGQERGTGQNGPVARHSLPVWAN